MYVLETPPLMPKSPELLDNYTLHAMNAYESEKLSAAGVETQPVFAIEGTVKKCLSDHTKLVIGNLEAGDPFDDDSDVLKVVLRFQRVGLVMLEKSSDIFPE